MAVENLGIANVKVKKYPKGPNLASYAKKYNFDISAFNHDVIMNSPYIKPLLAEYVEDTNGTFAAMFPSKRKIDIDNILNTGTQSSTVGKILWTPIDYAPKGVPDDIRTEGKFDSYTFKPPSQYANLPSDYKGPKWFDNPRNKYPDPDDRSSILEFWEKYSTVPIATTTTTTSANPKVETTHTIHQKTVRDGLWWAIESDSFLTDENTPFWVNFKSMNPPSSATHETCFVIRLGPDDPNNKYDIYISLNHKPRVIDYLGVDEGNSGGSSSGGLAGPSGPPNIPMQSEWDLDLSRIVANAPKDRDIEVGIMTIAGRLVVIVNNVPLVYTRINRSSNDDGGTILECKIPKGKIQIFGTNVETNIYACPMTFASLSVIALPLPTIVSDSGDGGPEAGGYKGCNYKGEPSGSVAELPVPPTVANKLYGVDCKEFTGDGGSCSPRADFFHKKGKITFLKASASLFGALPSTDFYTLSMEPDSTTTFAGKAVSYGGCPYFFRLKGVQEMESAPSSDGEDLSNYLISVDESAQAPDYFHIKKNATLTFYNPGNVIGASLQENQTVFDIEWGWSDGDNNSPRQKTFTGIVVSVNRSEVAGKETISVTCEDYMYVLNKVPIINSPFYDGMVAVWAIRDLAERAGMTGFVQDFWQEEDYFLPSGYSFTQPKLRFPADQKIFDCILDLVKRFEAYVYFDGDGVFHINKLEGGLFSEGAANNATAAFKTDPSGGSGTTILEEKNVEINYDSTVNAISIFTVDRNTRNLIFLSRVADDNKLVFLKPMLINQPALGDVEAARVWAQDLEKRVYKPILKTKFKTTGNGSIVQALEFITLDDQPFRVLSVKRAFNAETNDMNCSYECEWLGG